MHKGEKYWMIERDFDIALIAQMALSEKQIQQNYRPIIAVHKWFARRPGTLFRGLMLSEYASAPLQQSFYESHNLRGLTIADPFMGGGTPIIEANRLGCDVIGFDINPMAHWIVNQEIKHIDIDEYRKTAEELRATLESEFGSFYRTQCIECGSDSAHVKYFLWVKIQNCRKCNYESRREVVAIALNDVKPKYDVATAKNLLNVPVPELIARFMDDASVAVRKALEQVKERPNE